MTKILNRAIKLAGENSKVGTPYVTVLEFDSVGQAVRAKGATVPTDADAGYAKGCIFIQTDGGVTTTVYINEGTSSSADFNPMATAFSGIETIAGGGTTTALSLLKSLHSIDSDGGGDIFTLADGTIGQIMTITGLSATGTSTITPTHLSGGTSVTFNAAGDSVVLQFVDTSWYIIGGNSYTIS